jgi:hypothetical protein
MKLTPAPTKAFIEDQIEACQEILRVHKDEYSQHELDKYHVQIEIFRLALTALTRQEAGDRLAEAVKQTLNAGLGTFDLRDIYNVYRSSTTTAAPKEG